MHVYVLLRRLRNIDRATYCLFGRCFLTGRIGETCTSLVSDSASRWTHYLLAVQKARHRCLNFLAKQPSLWRVRYDCLYGWSLESCIWWPQITPAIDLRFVEKTEWNGKGDQARMDKGMATGNGVRPVHEQ